jgi:hypothetical protein
MAAEREALAAMLMVCANTVREAARVAAEEEAAHVAEAARAAARAKELAEETTADAAMQEEMARYYRRWDDDMAAVRRAREIHSSPHNVANAGTWPAAVET